MKAFRTEDIFPLSLDDTWDLLHGHVDETRLRKIHPRIISGQSIREGESVEFHGHSFPREKVAERVIRIGGRPSRHGRTGSSRLIDTRTRSRSQTGLYCGSITHTRPPRVGHW